MCSNFMPIIPAPEKENISRFLIGLLLLISIFFLFITLAHADLIVKGKRVVYTGDALTSGITLTESEIAPATPQVNDVWRDITDGTIYVWDGTVWVVKANTQDIKDEIAIFKANIGNVSDVATNKCLKSLKKMIFKLYKEDL